MKINITNYNAERRTFNVELASKDGAEPFLIIRDCRVMDGANGRFVSYPARKMDSGKWWNHVRGSDAFNSAVLTAVETVAPKDAPPSAKSTQADDDAPW